MSAFNTNMFGFASVAAASSGAETTLNEVIQYLDALRGPLLIEDCINSAFASIVPSAGQEGRFWLWNVDGEYTGTNAQLLALNQQVGGFARGALLWYTHGGWAYYDPALDTENRYILAVLRNTFTFDDNDAFGAQTNLTNALYQRNRLSNDGPAFLVFDNRGGAQQGNWSNANGWHVLGGTEQNQPFGWYGDPDVLFWNASSSAVLNVANNHEMAVGWHDSRLVRKLHLRLTTIPPLNADRFVDLDPSQRRIGNIEDLVSMRCLLNDTSVSETAGRVQCPLNVPNVGYHAWLDVVNKRFGIRRVANSIVIGGNTWDLSTENDYDSTEFILEYTSQY